ncbi:MAG: hypothetical protein JXA07_16340 [Spirochaetes bacterium]|nr:hypothetical protein [Spirochaetota bacterium]
MKRIPPVIAIMLVLVLAPWSGAHAAEEQKQDIPYEVIERQSAETAYDESTARRHRMALGVNIDPFPTVLSAVDREFGLSIQPWFSVNNIRILLDIAHFRIPDDCVATRYFHKNDINTFALSFEYTFGKNFDGFLVGAGFGIWQDSVKHRYFNESATSIRPFISIKGGYIWKFHKNLYIEPCLSLDIMLAREKLSVFWSGFTPLPAAGEITLKFGMYFDI